MLRDMSNTPSKRRKNAELIPPGDKRTRPDYTKKCQCGATPIVPLTGLCGPCTFGEAETAGGNW